MAKSINLHLITSILREEADHRVGDLTKKYRQQKSDTEPVAKGLKVKHTESKFVYTVISISPRDIVLRTPDGKDITIARDNFNKEYELA